VAEGQTLGGIARRYHVSISALCRANGIQRRSPIRPGQNLVIPDKNAPSTATPAVPSSSAKRTASTGGLQQLDVPGTSPVYYYEPTGPGRLTLRPVIFYLHGRGGSPASDCRRWASIARPLGWLVCPGGPSLHNGGRAWHNSWVSGQHVVLSALKALRAKFGRRVQLYGNTLIGFSEGAHVAMNLGVRHPRTFNRWLILAASDAYWGTKGIEALRRNRRTIRRVYLITGERDGVVDRTRAVRKWLRRARIATRISTPETLAHEVALQSKAGLYRMALIWLNRG
jgi:predicted esterase